MELLGSRAVLNKNLQNHDEQSLNYFITELVEKHSLVTPPSKVLKPKSQFLHEPQTLELTELH